MSDQVSSADLPEPGWYPDPEEPGQVRKWDGSKWTSETQEWPADDRKNPGSGSNNTNGKIPKWIWVVVGIVVVIVIGAALGSGSSEETRPSTAVKAQAEPKKANKSTGNDQEAAKESRTKPPKKQEAREGSTVDREELEKTARNVYADLVIDLAVAELGEQWLRDLCVDMAQMGPELTEAVFKESYKDWGDPEVPYRKVLKALKKRC